MSGFLRGTKWPVFALLLSAHYQQVQAARVFPRGFLRPLYASRKAAVHITLYLGVLIMRSARNLHLGVSPFAGRDRRPALMSRITTSAEPILILVSRVDDDRARRRAKSARRRRSVRTALALVRCPPARSRPSSPRGEYRSDGISGQRYVRTNAKTQRGA
jgi:hypothetical protein